MSIVKSKLAPLLAAIVAVLALSFGSLGPASADAATDVVRTKQTVLFGLLRQPSPANDQKIGAVFDEMLDYDGLAQASLGTEWPNRSDAEKAQFSDLLKQLVRKAYERNLKKTLDYTIDYTGEEPAGTLTLVKTKATSKVDQREDPIEINYKMGTKAGSFLVEDIITEGASLVSNYRTQFTKIIKKDGFPALVKKMQDKLAKGDVGT
jgi:phospholipid transport system substrate-binding protein